MTEKKSRPLYAELVRGASDDLAPRTSEALAHPLRAPVGKWMARLQTRQWEEYQKLLRVRASVADTIVEHQRAWGQLKRIDDYIALDDQKLDNALAAAKLEGKMLESQSEIDLIEAEIHVNEARAKRDRLTAEKKPPPKPGERAAERLEARVAATRSIRAKADELVDMLRAGRSDEQLSAAELHDIEEIIDAANQMIAEL